MNLLYSSIKKYIKVAVSFFYKDIKTTFLAEIPNDKPILFVANHQNAMMDPLVIATSVPRPIYFIARAAAFKNSVAAFLLRKLQAIAIYRVRDGVDSRKLNEAVFEHCLSLFKANNAILIFPEGSHSIKRQVRSLRLGFTRITLDFLKTNPTKEFIIIPVGLNYTDTKIFGASLHILYGKHIIANNLVSLDNEKESIKNLTNSVSTALQELTVHIPTENYTETVAKLSENDFLTPIETNKRIAVNDLEKQNTLVKKKTIFYRLMQLNSIFPFLIWKWMEPKIKQQEFISTAKFSLGISIFPIFYILQTSIIAYFLGSLYAIIYLVFSVLLVWLSRK